MCEPVTTALILTAASTGLSAYNTSRTAKKQDRILASNIQKQGERQKQANQRLNETLNFFQGSGPEGYADKLNEQFANSIRMKRGQALEGLQGEGDLSDAARKRAAAAEGTALDYGDFLSGVFSRIDAPAEQRRDENENRLDLGDFLTQIARNSAGDQRVTDMRLRGVQRNPWLDIIAAGMSGAGRGMAAGGGGAYSLFSEPAGGGVPGSILPPEAFYAGTSAATLPGMTGNNPAGLYGLLSG